MEELKAHLRADEEASYKEFSFYLGDGSVQLRRVKREFPSCEWPLLIIEPVHTAVEWSIEGAEPDSSGPKTRAFALKTFTVLEPPFYGSKIRFYVEV